MQGYWLYLAAAALSAASLALHVHWALTIIFHLFCLRIFLTKKRKLIIFSVIIYLIIFSLSVWSNNTHHKTFFSSNQTQFLITFLNKPLIDGNKLSAVVIANRGERLALNYIIRNKEEKTSLEQRFHSGTTCKVTGILSVPDKNRNENLFNYQQYLFRQNIHWKLKISDFTKCTKNGSGLLNKIKSLRESALAKIENQYPKEIMPYAKALLFGDRMSFEDDTYTLFQRLGIVHLLAISGLHVTLLYMGFYYFLIRIGMTRELSSRIIVLCLPFYAILCGANPPVIRASIMLIIILLSAHSRLSVTSIDGLSISFLLFLIKNPFIIFNVGFQLSFIVSLSILLSSQTIISRYKNGVLQLIVISFISQISSLPVMLYQFYQISIISIISNLFFVPLYSFVILPLMIFSFLSSFLFTGVFLALNKLLMIIIFLSEKFAKFLDFKWAVFIVGRPGIWVLLFIILATLYLFFCWEQGKKIHKLLSPLVLIIGLYFAYKYFNSNGEIDFIDIGQGDSILIQLPYHRGTYLIDTGGTIEFEEQEWMRRRHPFTIGNDILVPYLKSKGISKIDKLILTHSDADHMGAAKELIGNINVKRIYISPNSWMKPIMYDTVKAYQKENVTTIEVKDGYRWKNKSGSFQFIYPFENHYEGNNDSLVLFAMVGGKSWLFTGDLEEEGEEKIINTYSFHADVLKVGHHGSKTSTSQHFLENIQPAIAIISVGKNNRYGHPNNDVLMRLEDKQVKIFRTDLQGAVMYKFKRNKGTFQTVLP